MSQPLPTAIATPAAPLLFWHPDWSEDLEEDEESSLPSPFCRASR